MGRGAPPLDEHRVVVIGTSAGGVEALFDLFARLSHDFGAPICIVLHIPAESPSLLPSLLDRRTPLKVIEARDGLELKRGTVYVAPPDRHLTIDTDRTLLVTRGPRENRHRPAVDPLFRSAALAYGSGAV